MAHFLVSFRITANSTYQERYDSLIARIDALKTSTAVWDETSSVIVFEANGNAQSVCNSLYIGTKINTSMGDILIVMDTVNRQVAQQGCQFPSLLKGYLGY